MLGVIISQLMRLTHSDTPDPVFGFLVISIPFSAVCHIMALLITCVGCYRYLHWQAEMVRGKAISGGWELITMCILSMLVGHVQPCLVLR